MKIPSIVVIALLALLASGCRAAPAPAATPTAMMVATATVVAPQGEQDNQSAQTAAGDLAVAVSARTPEPTPTSGVVERKIDEFAASRGMFNATFLGLTTQDWINLAVSILIALAGYLLGARLVIGMLRWGAKRTPMAIDDAFVDYIEINVKWLVTILFARFAALRLDVRSDEVRLALDDLFFMLILVVVTMTTLKAIRFAATHYRQKLKSQDKKAQLNPVIQGVQRLSEFLVLVIALSVGMSHFGISVNALTATIVIGGLVLALGARDLIADAIAGFIILSDQPFRVGDAVLLTEPDMWGDVLQIGARTTRIRTRDNRVVIVRNSQIGQGRIVNYAYPDLSYRLQSDVRIGYDTDLELARQVIADAVRQVAGVLTVQPVEVFFLEFGESARLLRVRWWIDNYQDKHPMLDRVNEAIERALKQAGIEIAYTRVEYSLRTDTHPS